jgi:hypothetical protein
MVYVSMKTQITTKFTITVVAVTIFVSLLVVIGIMHAVWGRSTKALGTEVNSYESANIALTDTVEKYYRENTQFQQDMTIAQQEIEDWKSYAQGVSAQVIYVPEIHEQTTVKEVTVDKPVVVNNAWREFESPAVLMSWTKDHLTTLWISGNQVADCDDYASRLQLEALKDGYILSVQLVLNGMVNGKNVSNYLGSHMGNLAMIGNEIYFIEPQPEYFRIVYVCDRD